MKHLIAITLSAALALAPAAAPAQTRDRALDRDDRIAAILFGLATLAIIGKAIEDRDDRRDRANRTDRADSQWHRPRDLDRPGDRWHRDGLDIPANRRVLPGECLRRVETRHGPVRFFARRCLNRNYRYADRLPARCEMTVRTDRGVRHGYHPACLRQSGFTMARF